MLVGAVEVGRQLLAAEVEEADARAVRAAEFGDLHVGAILLLLAGVAPRCVIRNSYL